MCRELLPASVDEGKAMRSMKAKKKKVAGTIILHLLGPPSSLFAKLTETLRSAMAMASTMYN